MWSVHQHPCQCVFLHKNTWTQTYREHLLCLPPRPIHHKQYIGRQRGLKCGAAALGSRLFLGRGGRRFRWDFKMRCDRCGVQSVCCCCLVNDKRCCGLRCCLHALPMAETGGDGWEVLGTCETAAMHISFECWTERSRCG